MVDVPGSFALRDDASPNVTRQIGVMLDTNGVEYPQHINRAVALAASTQLETSHIFRIIPASVYSVTVSEVSADSILLLIDAAVVPPDGAVTPMAWARVTSPGAAEVNFGAVPGAFLVGLIAVLSSAPSPFVKTSGPTGCFYAKVN